MKLILSTTLALTVALAANAYATDLLDVYRESLANDPQFASARAQLNAGQERQIQTRAGLLPTVAFTGSWLRSQSDSSAAGAVNSTPTFDTRTYTLSLTQPLFRLASWETYQQGKLSTAVSEAQFELARQSLILRVAQAYFDVLAAQDTLATVQAQKTAINEQLAAAKRNFEVGTTTITDSQEAQARYDLAVAQEHAALNELDVRRSVLQQLIGHPPGELNPLRSGLALSPPEPTRIEPWLQSASEHNVSVITQRFTVDIAKREIARTRAGHYPSVDLVASRSRNDPGFTPQSPSGLTTDTRVVGIQVSIPIFSGLGVQSQVREAVALQERAHAELENARRTAEQEVRQAFLGISSGLAQVKALEAAEVSSKVALESNLLGYQVGVRINIDVLNAQQQLYSTRQNLARARYDVVLHGLRLKQAAGTLTEEDLMLANALLQR